MCVVLDTIYRDMKIHYVFAFILSYLVKPKDILQNKIKIFKNC